MGKSRALALLLALSAVGCAPHFDSPSKLGSLRVLAVQKDKPYAHPGDTVTLRMLLTDASKSGPRHVNIAWLGGCENPLADAYAGCFADLAKGGAGSFVQNLQLGQGLEYSLSLSPDIISRRP